MRDQGGRFVGNCGAYLIGVALLLIVLGLGMTERCAAQEPSVTGDAAWIAGGAVAWELGCNAINCTEWHKGRAYSWPDLSQTPSSDYGCLPWCEAEVSHYVTWGVLGFAMSAKGHSPLAAWALSGLWANLVWEYGIESTYTRPSGHDLIINAGSAAVGVGLHKLADAIF